MNSKVPTNRKTTRQLDFNRLCELIYRHESITVLASCPGDSTMSFYLHGNGGGGVFGSACVADGIVCNSILLNSNIPKHRLNKVMFGVHLATPDMQEGRFSLSLDEEGNGLLQHLSQTPHRSRLRAGDIDSLIESAIVVVDRFSEAFCSICVGQDPLSAMEVVPRKQRPPLNYIHPEPLEISCDH